MTCALRCQLRHSRAGFSHRQDAEGGSRGKRPGGEAQERSSMKVAVVEWRGEVES